MAGNIILSTKSINKTFGSVKAVIGMDFDLRKGEVHALLGENGAGKSTFIKVLGGIYGPDSGKIFLNGREIKISNPHIATESGINVIHQEIKLLDNATVGENIFINHEPIKNGMISWVNIFKESNKTLSELDDNIDSKTILGNLNIAQKQLVQIAKALSLKAKILIMDEPTAALNNEETENLFKLIKKLRDEGVAIIYISHRLSEVFSISDRITVMRDGRKIGTVISSLTNMKKVINMMIGKDIKDLYPKRKHIKIGNTILELKDVWSFKNLKSISFELKRKEVLGFAGLKGSGVKELAYLLFGMEPKSKGEIIIFGREHNFKSPKDAVELGLGFVPDDRRRTGLFTGLSVYENIIMANIDKMTKFGIINKKKATKIVLKFIRKLFIKTSSTGDSVSKLSGGNQQKVVLAKWLATKLKVLILLEPTFGVDVGAKVEIYSIINDLIEEGVSIILISSDMAEIIGLSDRVICLHEGKISGEFHASQADEEIIRAHCSGVDI